MMTQNTTELDDAELVGRSRSGDREAFGELIARYQSLVCSLGYSATGSLPQSEDLAQETFLTAWRQLATLREPAKARSWLCGIARNVINNWLRTEGRQPTRGAASLETLSSQSAPEPLPADQAVSSEEAALLWRSLERIPETYREPLILFYREHKSIATVAQTLELTEDAVKQRLSRGRKLLQEEVATFVEKTLTRSAPGRAFTLGVVAALPAFALSASAASAGAAAAKGSATATAAGSMMWLNILIGPLLGLAGAWFGVRASLNATRTPRERAFVVRQTMITLGGVIVFNLLIFGYIWGVMPRFAQHPIAYSLIGMAIPVVFAGFIVASALWHNKGFATLRIQEQAAHPEKFPAAQFQNPAREYKSKATLLGIPLVHVAMGSTPGQPRRRAVGWIAFGDTAYGILLAVGGIAFGGIAFGGVCVGGLALGGLSFGALALGGLAVGGIALGGGAIGYLAAGGFALGHLGAMGGLAIASKFALGGAAFAEHANDLAARNFIAERPWMDIRRENLGAAASWLRWLPLAFVIPMIALRKKFFRRP